MKKILLLVFIFVIGCSKPIDPKEKFYNEETLSEDISTFTEKERELLGDFILRQEYYKAFSENEFLKDTIDDSLIINVNFKTYAEIINLQKDFLIQEAIQDSLNKIAEEKRRIEREEQEKIRRAEEEAKRKKAIKEEEERRKEIEQRQKAFSELIEITVIGFEDEVDEFGIFPKTILSIQLNSVEGKKVTNLDFYLIVYDKKGNELGKGRLNVSSTFQDTNTARFSLSELDYSSREFYSLLRGSSVEDYSYGVKFISVVYDGELVEF